LEKNPVVCTPSKKFVVNQGKLSQVQNHFTFHAKSVLKKVNINVWQAFHDLFQISGVTLCFVQKPSHI
jgi:hypothetical protein